MVVPAGKLRSEASTEVEFESCLGVRPKLEGRKIAGSASSAISLGDAAMTAEVDTTQRHISGGGLVSLPLTTARTMIRGWSRLLGLMPGQALRRVRGELTSLETSLTRLLSKGDGGTDSKIVADDGHAGRRRAEALEVGERLSALGFATRDVALLRSGPMAMALEALADSLIFAGAAVEEQAGETAAQGLEGREGEQAEKEAD